MVSFYLDLANSQFARRLEEAIAYVVRAQKMNLRCVQRFKYGEIGAEVVAG